MGVFVHPLAFLVIWKKKITYSFLSNLDDFFLVWFLCLGLPIHCWIAAVALPYLTSKNIGLPYNIWDLPNNYTLPIWNLNFTKSPEFCLGESSTACQPFTLPLTSRALATLALLFWKPGCQEQLCLSPDPGLLVLDSKKVDQNNCCIFTLAPN